MPIIIGPKVRQKLANKIPPVTEDEIREWFQNRWGPVLIDTRPEHRTKPPTRWFISDTDSMRRLKVVFVTLPSGDHAIKTAYEPDEIEEELYEAET